MTTQNYGHAASRMRLAKIIPTSALKGRLFLTLLMMLLTTMTAWANDPDWLKQGDIWDEATKTLTVNSNPDQSEYWYNTDIEHVIISDDVTSIGISAFRNCTNLKTIFIGNGVASIAGDVFNGCTSLKTVIISRTSSAPSINGLTFPPNFDLKIYVPMDSNGNIPEDYKSGNWAIYNSSNILVASKTSGTCAVAYKNNALTVVGFAMADTDIGSLQLMNYQAANVTSLVIEDGVTHIGGDAFKGCSNLPSVTIPASVTSIGDQAFSGCSSLPSITISANVQSIGSGAFSGCSSLATITVDANNSTFDSRDDCNAIILTDDDELVAGCKNTTIPEDVQSIGSGAFSGCGSLTSITIPASVTSIGDQAFESCGLSSITIPDGVQSIGGSAFYNCLSLKSVAIGSGVESMSPGAFNMCINLRTITVDANNQTFDSRDGCNAIILTDDDELVVGCYATVIPTSVKSIGNQAFRQVGLLAITIPNSVQSIGTTAFNMCTALTHVTIGSGVTSIGDAAFQICNDLENVTIYATSVPTLGASVFDGNKSGRKIYVFSDCVEAYKAAWGGYANDIEAIGGTCGKTNSDNVTWELAGELGNCTLIISGTGAMSDYSAGNQPWAAYNADITKVIIKNGVTTISSGAFNQGTIITLSYTAPDGYAFAGYTVTDENDDEISVTENNGVYTFVMPASDVTVAVGLLQVYDMVTTVSYLDADGVEQTQAAKRLTGGGAPILQPGWYMVNSDISYTGTVTLGGDVNIILCDGKTMIANGDSYGINGSSDGTLTIYGQALGTGTLNATGTVTNGIGIVAEGTIIINGGTVNANGTGEVGIRSVDGVTINRGTVTTTGIMADGNVTINGGKVTSTEDPGISSNSGSITLSWTSPDDRICAPSYAAYGTITATKAFHNGSEVLSGTINNSDYATKLDDKTLIGVDVLHDAAGNDIAALATRLGGKQTNITLQGRTLYKDGKWNTLCLPFDVEDGDNTDELTFSGTPLEGATVMELDTEGTYEGKHTGLDGTTLYLYFKNATSIEAGKPYIVRWGTPESNPGGTITDPVFNGVTMSDANNDIAFTGGSFKGTYEKMAFAEENKSILFVGNNNNLHWPEAGASLGACRAYFQLAGAQASEFVLNFGAGSEEMSISPAEIKEITESAGAWYTINGVRLNSKPTQKGLYIHNGRKVVIK